MQRSIGMARPGSDGNLPDPALIEYFRRLIVQRLLAPAAPHVADEAWELLGCKGSVIDAPWPSWDEELAADEQMTVVVQVNGKLRDKLQVPVDVEQEAVLAAAREAPNAARFLDGKNVVKEIYVPGKLVNFVAR